MTREIDTYYLLDEIEILTEVVKQLASVPFLSKQKAAHISGLFEELKQRKDWRQRAPSGDPHRLQGMRGTKELGGLDTIDIMLDALRVMPSFEAVVEILIAHEVEREAREQRISEQLIHSAIATSATMMVDASLKRVSLRLPAQPVFLTDPTSDEPHTVPLSDESWMPFLPEDVQKRWKATLTEITARYMAMEHDELAAHYEKYLNHVLNTYAFGDPVTGQQFPVAELNEVNNEAVESDHHRLVYSDTFWHRWARVSWITHGEVKAGDVLTLGDPRAGEYVVEIVFEPREILKMRSEGDLKLLRYDEVVFSRVPSAAIRSNDDLFNVYVHTGTGVDNVIVQASIAMMNKLEETKGWLALYVSRGGSGTQRGRMAVGRTKTEAMVSLVRPEVKTSGHWYDPRDPRPMTAEEKELLTSTADEKPRKISIVLDSHADWDRKEAFEPVNGLVDEKDEREALRNDITEMMSEYIDVCSIKTLRAFADALKPAIDHERASKEVSAKTKSAPEE